MDEWGLAAVQSVTMECKSLVIALALLFRKTTVEKVCVFVCVWGGGGERKQRLGIWCLGREGWWHTKMEHGTPGVLAAGVLRGLLDVRFA